MASRVMQASRASAVDPQLLLALQALADPARLHILVLLRQREQCVCHLTEALNLTQGTISHHMGVLKRAGLVQDRRDVNDSRWVYYRLNSDKNTSLKASLIELLDTTAIDPTPALCCGE